jgi:hypothetical protein
MFKNRFIAGFLPVFLLMLAALAAAQPRANEGGKTSNRPARPQNAAETIFAAFERVPLVALGEAHHLQTEHFFIQDLLRRPEFPAHVRDIVIEFASARYQNVIERFVNGEQVPFNELSQVWRNTPVSPAEQWDSPVYEQFFRTVREINAALPEEKRLRVWAAEPPIDWSAVSSAQEVFSWRLRREEHIASVVVNQVLSRGRKALIIYGASHLTRKSASLPGLPTAPQNALQIVERSYPNSTFIVLPHLGFGERGRDLERNFDDWEKPSIALIDKTWLGRLDPRLVIKDNFVGAPGAPQPNPWEGLTLQDIADAYLYMGDHDELTRVAPSPYIYRDDEYFNELNRRTMIMRGVPIDEKAPQYFVYGFPVLPTP